MCKFHIYLNIDICKYCSLNSLYRHFSPILILQTESTSDLQESQIGEGKERHEINPISYLFLHSFLITSFSSSVTYRVN